MAHPAWFAGSTLFILVVIVVAGWSVGRTES